MSANIAPAEEQRPHHPFSPSQLQSLEACPCYEGQQSKVSHPRTIIGTLSHAVIETGEDNPELSDEDADKIADCIDFYEQRKQLMLASGPQIIELKETYLPIDDEVFTDAIKLPDGTFETRRVESTTAGYIDCAIISHDGEYCELFDWKLGFHPVTEASNNLQGLAYALGMLKRYPTLQTVRYFFKQPNIDYVTDATIRREDIPKHYLRIQVVVAKARASRAAGDFLTARATAPACSFCKHIAICPIVTAFACQVGAKFAPLQVPENITPSMVHSPTDTKAGLQLASVLEVWTKAFRNTITNRVLCMQAEVPEGYALESRTPREIADPAKYKETALRYLTPEEYEATLKPSLGKVEEKISEKAPRGQKTAAIKLFSKEAEDSGAIERGESYTFLKVKPAKPKE